MSTAKKLAYEMDKSLAAAKGPLQINGWCQQMRQRIIEHQERACENMDKANSTYLPGSRAYSLYYLSFRYALRVYSRCRVQLTFWCEGGKGKIPAEAECHPN